MNIMKIVAIKYQILRLKSASDRAGEAYSDPPDPLAGFKRLTSKERKGKEGSGGRGGVPSTFCGDLRS